MAALLSGCAGEGELPATFRAPAAGTGTTSPVPAAEPAPPPPAAAHAPAPSPGTISLTLQRQVGSDVHLFLAAAFRDASGKAVEAPPALDWTLTLVRRADPSGQPTQATPDTVGRGSRLPAVVQVEWGLPGTYSIAASVRAPGFRDGSQILQVHRPPNGGSGSPAPPSAPSQEEAGSISVTLSNATVGHV
ncbi:MAG TPA: hypothetical protein VHI93_00265, partial [Candidatus Thermoplasmatota archaeon]|nr:hypothetical protein [Candidatus Thermoplasmatota archaeon]